MSTVVETFYVEETINLVHDNDALQKWNERVNELGLEGQKNVVKVDKSPIPFLWMNTALINTFETLCPSKADVAAYDKTPIPVEILDAVALCKREQYFDLIEIWFNEKEKDPVCVGYKYKQKNETEWYKKHTAEKYLIGRWADVKASLDNLIERAKTLYISKTTNQIKQEIKHSQRRLEDLEDEANERFGNAMPLTPMPGF